MFINILIILMLSLAPKNDCYLISEKKVVDDTSNVGFFTGDKIKISTSHYSKKLILIKGYEYKIVVYNSNNDNVLLNLNDVWFKNVLYVTPKYDSVEFLEIQNINCGILVILFKKK